MAIEIVDFPIKIVIFHSYVKLPEGIIQQPLQYSCSVGNAMT